MIDVNLNKYWHKQLHEQNSNWINRIKALHSERGYQVVRITGKSHVFSKRELPNDEKELYYQLHATFLIKKNQHFYREEQCRLHEAHFYKNQLRSDRELPENFNQETEQRTNPIIEFVPRSQFERFSYDRNAAVRYAELWWNDANPAYEFFEVNDCTNYVSQCLRAGGAPMRGYPNRATGWWYQNRDWSFSWSVAHALRWYLGGSTKGLQAREVDSPDKLLPGDVICYDFEGNGRFDHTTIVVAKNADQMPLVNAHTNNSRHRYWDYRDSMAWTPECQYKFYRIGTDML